MIQIVLAKESQVDEVAKIFTNEHFDSFEEVKEHYLKKIKTKEAYVALLNGEIVGAFGYRRVILTMEIIFPNIVVSDDHRRKGIATALMNKFIEVSKKEQSKKQKYALSSTSVTNEASINMHLKFGFKNLGTIKELHFGEDEIFFGYDLTE